MSRSGFVYFVESEDGGPIKVGFTSKPVSRLQGLRTWSPLRLSIMGYVEGDTLGEGYALARLANYQKHGEWFYRSPPVDRFIERVLSGEVPLPRWPSAAADWPQNRHCKQLILERLEDCGITYEDALAISGGKKQYFQNSLDAMTAGGNATLLGKLIVAVEAKGLQFPLHKAFENDALNGSGNVLPTHTAE